MICGDLNFDVRQENENIQTFMLDTFACQQYIHQPTTSHDTTLDLIFSNRTVCETSVIECVWSDHKLVACAVEVIDEKMDSCKLKFAT